MESTYRRPRELSAALSPSHDLSALGLSDHTFKFARTVHEGRADITYITQHLPTSAEQQPRSLAFPSDSVQIPSTVELVSDVEHDIPQDGVSDLACQIHRTVGKHPPALVGASTTICGDKLYVFGGRRLSRRRSQLTAHLYELDLITRRWERLETRGDAPAPRYFHSVCALGDTKLVCYGGMAPMQSRDELSPSRRPAGVEQEDPGIVVMSDIHIYDIQTQTWTAVPAANPPQGRYAHCACITPSYAVFASAAAPLSALLHNPASNQPNQGSLGISIDGRGGAEMFIVGGQDSGSNYIEQINVFNLRSLTWTTLYAMDKSCGAYRSVVAPYDGLAASQIGSEVDGDPSKEHDAPGQREIDHGTAMLIYSNYNFLDVKLELQIRHANGTVTDKQLPSGNSPPGLRFPSGGIINNHLVVSGTFLTSTRQEYAIWALNLLTFQWTRIDTSHSIFVTTSWNKGILWPRRNMYLILGDRTRRLADDYNQRRTNFVDLCVVELESFGLCDNPRTAQTVASYESVSSSPQNRLDAASGGRELGEAATRLGLVAIQSSGFSDMDMIAIDGQRIPANSHLLKRRWGIFYARLLQENAQSGRSLGPRRLPSQASRSSSATITGSRQVSTTSTVFLHDDVSEEFSTMTAAAPLATFPPAGPSRATLFLPHTKPTITALLHYLYTSSMPNDLSPAEEQDVLCSLLQLARPYTIDGLLEASSIRLHRLLDKSPSNSNTAAAIFNAAALAAGSGSAIVFEGFAGSRTAGTVPSHPQIPVWSSSRATSMTIRQPPEASKTREEVQPRVSLESEERDGSASASRTSTSRTSVSGGEAVSLGYGGEADEWRGGIPSVVIGLQKRALRMLMETKRRRDAVEEGNARGAEAVGPVH